MEGHFILCLGAEYPRGTGEGWNLFCPLISEGHDQSRVGPLSIINGQISQYIRWIIEISDEHLSEPVWLLLKACHAFSELKWDRVYVP